MSREWDSTDNIAFQVETWAQVYRVLKPGAFLVAMGGTRTYHRMACAIEDAGFEIRDSVSYLHSAGPLLWVYGSGFPKSMNVSNGLNEKRCLCSMHESTAVSPAVSARAVLQSEMRGHREANTADREDVRGLRQAVDAARPLSSGKKQDVFACMQCSEDITGQNGEDQGRADAVRILRQANLQGSDTPEAKREDLLQPFMPGEGACSPAAALCGEHEGESAEGQALRGQQSILEGRRNLSSSSRQLRQREVRSLSARFGVDGEERRLCDGASFGDGALDQAHVDADRVRASLGSQPAKQQEDEFRTVAGQSEPQERGAWPRCGRCGKPIIPDGLGTALKPAMELICMARKPLSEPTIAANVLKWGTGAINIDGCRVGTDEQSNRAGGRRPSTHEGYQRPGATMYQDKTDWELSPRGRWPANIIHDGSEEVLAAFPDSVARPADDAVNGKGSGSGELIQSGVYGSGRPSVARTGYRDSETSAARFFYTAKADSDDRLGSKHPTVKPLDLMQYLVRLVTPNGGTTLDSFAGTGTTAEAAWREGMSAILIEREAEYQDDIRRRMALVLAGPDERWRESIKAQNLPRDDGPLFGGQQ